MSSAPRRSIIVGERHGALAATRHTLSARDAALGIDRRQGKALLRDRLHGAHVDHRTTVVLRAEPGIDADGHQRIFLMISPPWRIASSFCGSIFQARSGSDFFSPTITFSIFTTGQTFR